MVTRLLYLALISNMFLFASNLYAEINFSVNVSTHKVELGKTFTLTLTAQNELPKLNNIDLNQLALHFHINTTANIEYNEQTRLQSWKLRLTPYNKGLHKIPSLYFNSMHSEALPITVTEAIDKKTGTPINLETQVSTHTPWVREQVLINFHLQTNIERAQIKVAETKLDNTVIQRLDVGYDNLATTPSTTHYYQTGWAIFPLASGNIKITLPPVELIRDGVTTHRFYHAPIDLIVRALPLYIPSTIPVGLIELSIDSTTKYFINENLYEYKIILTGKNILADNLPDISNQMASDKSIRIYPANTRTNQNNAHNGIISNIEYVFPVKALRQGTINLADIKLSYFDTTSGTLKTYQHPNLSLLSVNKWLSWLLTVIIIILLAMISKLIINRAIRYYKKMRTYLQAIKILRQSCTLEQLKISLALLSSAEGHSMNITPRSWFNTVPRKNQPMNDITEEINKLFYRNRKDTVAEKITKSILSIALSNQPFLRWLYRKALI